MKTTFVASVLAFSALAVAAPNGGKKDWCKNGNYKKGEDENIVELEGVPQQNKQRLCKDMKLIEMLTDLLYYPTGPSGICALSDIAKPGTQNLLKIHQLCYRLIKHSIREYRPSEIYASQWINMFMSHTLETKKKRRES